MTKKEKAEWKKHEEECNRKEQAVINTHVKSHKVVFPKDYFKDCLDLKELVGATVVNIGCIINGEDISGLTEEALTIDYIKNGIKKRYVLGANELGIWKIAHLEL